jgi:hypothetical protein
VDITINGGNREKLMGEKRAEWEEYALSTLYACMKRS